MWWNCLRVCYYATVCRWTAAGRRQVQVQVQVLVLVLVVQNRIMAKLVDLGRPSGLVRFGTGRRREYFSRWAARCQYIDAGPVLKSSWGLVAFKAEPYRAPIAGPHVAKRPWKVWEWELLASGLPSSSPSPRPPLTASDARHAFFNRRPVAVQYSPVHCNAVQSVSQSVQCSPVTVRLRQHLCYILPTYHLPTLR